MKYREHKNLNFAKAGRDILAYWKEQKIFEKSLNAGSGDKNYSFYEGPPSANGTPGIHHVIARTVKDIFCRYKTLQGYRVERKGGWDTHGLPVELQVEKQLGITKDDIGKKISVEEYNAKCKEAVMQYKKEWDDLTELMGYWVDLDNPYITFERDYMESVWWLLKQFYDKGLLYKGFTIQPYSPAAGSGLSTHELNQPGCYRDVKDTTCVAQFKVIRDEKSEKLFEGTDTDVYFLAWTTTPWTLPSNTALAVGANIKYVSVKTYNPYNATPVTVILAKELLNTYFSEKAAGLPFEDYKEGDKEIPFKVISEFTGKSLEGIEYEQLIKWVRPKEKAFRVLIGDFVTTEDGTGIVHLAPTFGADDFRVAQRYGMPAILVTDKEGKENPLVDRKGKFYALEDLDKKYVENYISVADYGEFAGKFVKNEYDSELTDKDPSIDVHIAVYLKQSNKAFKIEKHVHNYPHCWRTDKPVLYYPLDSWFIKTTACKDRLVELNNTINWKPASTGTGRFGNWLENLVDWNLSRSRYWGTPLPIWRTEDGKEEICIGSLAELKEEIEKSIKAGFMDKQIDDDFDLHRPYVDDIILTSPSGQKMMREADLIDVWFDSGAMPYAQLHYPFENEDIFKKGYPADFIAEGVDQTRGWFFTLHAIAGMLFDSVAFKNVIANGLVLDKNGNKMSKRLGNAINPFETIDEFGPDATRWYMICNANPWDNLKFDINGVGEAQRRFFGTLQNTYSFFALYANLDNFDYKKDQVPVEKRTESDQWILSRLNTLIGEVRDAYEDYEPTKSARAIQNFVIDDLSNWYVRLNRKRFWKGELNEDKIAAYQTLHTCLSVVAQLASPIAPFYMDMLYLDLNIGAEYGGNSVHLTKFPEKDNACIDKNLEEKMDLAQKISSLVHSLRKQHKLKVRQPLSRILIPVLDGKVKEQIQAVEQLIITEVNIKAIEYVDNTSGVIVKKAKPNFRKLGQEYGPKMKDLSKVISELGQDQISLFETKGEIEIMLGDDKIALKEDDLLIQSEDIPGWIVASEGGLTVALDITITDDLKKEGIARDLVNRIQNLRKDMGLEVQDKIKISVLEGDEIIKDAISSNENYICTETQALEIEMTEQLEDPKIMEIDDLTVVLSITVA